MQAKQNPDGPLTLYYDSSTWASGLLSLAALFLVVAGYFYWNGETNTDRFLGMLMGSGVFLIAGLGCIETALVRVDVKTRTIAWSKRIAIWKTSGKLNFKDVLEVSIESPTGTLKVPMQRISLTLNDGTRLPLTYGARPDDGRLLHAAELFRKALQV